MLVLVLVFLFVDCHLGCFVTSYLRMTLAYDSSTDFTTAFWQVTSDAMEQLRHPNKTKVAKHLHSKVISLDEMKSVIQTWCQENSVALTVNAQDSYGNVYLHKLGRDGGWTYYTSMYTIFGVWITLNARSIEKISEVEHEFEIIGLRVHNTTKKGRVVIWRETRDTSTPTYAEKKWWEIGSLSHLTADERENTWSVPDDISIETITSALERGTNFSPVKPRMTRTQKKTMQETAASMTVSRAGNGDRYLRYFGYDTSKREYWEEMVTSSNIHLTAGEFIEDLRIGWIRATTGKKVRIMLIGWNTDKNV